MASGDEAQRSAMAWSVSVSVVVAVTVQAQSQVEGEAYKCIVQVGDVKGKVELTFLPSHLMLAIAR